MHSRCRIWGPPSRQIVGQTADSAETGRRGDEELHFLRRVEVDREKLDKRVGIVVLIPAPGVNCEFLEIFGVKPTHTIRNEEIHQYVFQPSGKTVLVIGGERDKLDSFGQPSFRSLRSGRRKLERDL